METLIMPVLSQLVRAQRIHMIQICIQPQFEQKKRIFTYFSTLILLEKSAVLTTYSNKNLCVQGKKGCSFSLTTLAHRGQVAAATH